MPPSTTISVPVMNRASRLHDDAPLDPKVRVQGKEPLLWCFAGREAAPGGERKMRLRPEHVHMRIARARGEHEPRATGVRMIRERRRAHLLREFGATLSR